MFELLFLLVGPHWACGQAALWIHPGTRLTGSKVPTVRPRLGLGIPGHWPAGFWLMQER